MDSYKDKLKVIQRCRLVPYKSPTDDSQKITNCIVLKLGRKVNGRSIAGGSISECPVTQMYRDLKSEGFPKEKIRKLVEEAFTKAEKEMKEKDSQTKLRYYLEGRETNLYYKILAILW